MTSHATFAPSASHRWLYCPLSLQLEEKQRASGIEPKEESEQARAGTEAHEKLSKILSSYYNKEEAVVIDISDKYINLVASHIINTYPKNNYTVESEATLYLDEFTYGTCDVLVIDKAKNIPVAIFDLKYGEVPVQAMGNTQLLMYAYLICKLYRAFPESMLLGIYQPRCEIAMDFWTITYENILMFEMMFENAKKYYFNEPSTHRGYPKNQCDSVCKYCPVKYTLCPHTTQAVKEVNNNLVMSNDINDLSLKSEQEIFLLKNRGRITGYLDELHARYKKRLQEGEKIKGLKLTKDRETKKWKDEEEAKRIMQINGINPYTVKLKTPAQVLKEDKDKILGIESFIEIEKKGSYIVED